MTTILNEVMKKVRRVFFLQRLVAPLAFLVATGVVVAYTVSISNVVANMPTLVDVQAVTKFFVAAFAHADVIVKCALVAGTAFLLMTLKGIVDSLRMSSVLERISL